MRGRDSGHDASFPINSELSGRYPILVDRLGRLNGQPAAGPARYEFDLNNWIGDKSGSSLWIPDIYYTVHSVES